MLYISLDGETIFATRTWLTLAARLKIKFISVSYAQINS